MEIRPVESRADLKHFIELPYRLYHHDPTWVPPLRSEQWGQFDPKRNPMLDHCEYGLFLRWDGEPIGRISAFVDRLAVDALLYRRLYEALYCPQLRFEINYVLEDNVRMNNALRNLGVKDLRRYRVYEMAI